MDRKQDESFVRRLVFSYSIVLVIILILGVSLYNIYIRNLSFEIRNQNKLILMNTIQDMNNNFATMDSLAEQVASNSNITHLANMPDNTHKDFYKLALRAKEELANFLPTQAMLPIETYFIYLMQPGYILSFSQFADISLYYSGKQKYVRDLYDEWLTMMDNPENYRQFISLEPYKKNPYSNYLYMLTLGNYSLRNIPATICFEIDKNKLAYIFNELQFFNTGYLCVTDMKGNIVFTLKGDQAGEISLDTLQSLEYKDSFARYGSGKNEMFVTKIQSDYNIWNYYLVQPYDASLYSLEHYRNIFAGIICLAITMGFLWIYLLSKKNAKPVIELGNELQDTITKHRTLQQIVEDQKPILQYTYLNRILKGMVTTPKELDFARSYLCIDTENRKFAVLYMMVYINQYEFRTDNPIVAGSSAESFNDVMHTAFSKFFDEPIYMLSSAGREYSVLLSSPIDEPVEISTEKIKDAFHKLYEYLMLNYSILIFAGLGDWNRELMVTWKSYQQAFDAVSYASSRQIFCEHSNIKRDENFYYYPIELSVQLTNFITSGNESQVQEFFNIIRHENMEKRSLSINMVQCLLSDIRNTLLKARYTLHNDDSSSEKLQAIDRKLHESISLNLYEEVAMELCKLFESKYSVRQLITNIKEYIQNNYSDPSLCLNKVSDEFSISVSYLSFLFKEETGENFSTYLERIRMAQAAKLIKETNINICDLYQEIGYSNPNTFRRSFKKVFGVSPKTMREISGVSPYN